MKINFGQILNNTTAKYIGVGLIAFSGGTGVGYLIGRKKNKEMTHISKEPEQLSLFDQHPVLSEDPNVNLDRPWVKETLMIDEDGTETKEVLHSNNLKEWVTPTVTEIDGNEDKYVNVFKSNDDQWEYEAELAIRTPNAPYVIHRDEYVCEEMGYEQTTVTYYAGDDIMTDINDVPIYNHGSMMSPLKFGHGSGDPNVVYIRNESLELEWEVLLHTGRYSVEVLGLEVERHYDNDNLAHSRSVLKFRDE